MSNKRIKRSIPIWSTCFCIDIHRCGLFKQTNRKLAYFIQKGNLPAIEHILKRIKQPLNNLTIIVKRHQFNTFYPYLMNHHHHHHHNQYFYQECSPVLWAIDCLQWNVLPLLSYYGIDINRPQLCRRWTDCICKKNSRSNNNNNNNILPYRKFWTHGHYTYQSALDYFFASIYEYINDNYLNDINLLTFYNIHLTNLLTKGIDIHRINSLMNKPFSLKLITRNQIRKQIGSIDFHRKINNIDLPKQLITFIQYINYEQFVIMNDIPKQFIQFIQSEWIDMNSTIGCNDNTLKESMNIFNQSNDLEQINNNDNNHDNEEQLPMNNNNNNSLQRGRASERQHIHMYQRRINKHKQPLRPTSAPLLRTFKHHHKEWISIETLDKIKERKNKKVAINNNRTRAEKVQAQAEYTEANKQVKRSIRADKKKYVEEPATTAEKTEREGNMKQLCDTTKKLTGKYSKPERPVKDKEGRPITEIQQQRNRWVEYFEELLNRPAPMNPPDIESAHTDLPIDVNPPTTEEIRMAIRQIKSGKGAGPDNILSEALKAGKDCPGQGWMVCAGVWPMLLYED
ncbi:unnamed protein product [Schistosoma curassoni]|uniref:SOCS box domain-containing protein n=1 Tax=Schistosoma curassoni TaxID=6186 RepID=A0A183K0J2_9TREM|nr:unnamed protein product [Schistosoma curassoni]